MTSLSGAPHKPTACPKNRVRYTRGNVRRIIFKKLGRLCLTQSAAAAGYHCFHQATLAIADTGGIAFLMPLFQATNYERLL